MSWLDDHPEIRKEAGVPRLFKVSHIQLASGEKQLDEKGQGNAKTTTR